MGEAQGGGSRAKAEANHISGRPEENSGGAKSAVGEGEARSLTARFPHVCASRSPLAVECEGLKLLRRLARSSSSDIRHFLPACRLGMEYSLLAEHGASRALPCISRVAVVKVTDEPQLRQLL